MLPDIILFEKGTQNIHITFFFASTQEKMFTPNHLAAADEENLNTDTDRRPGHADGILIARPCHNVLPLCRRAHSRKLVAQPCSNLKMVCLSSMLHTPLKCTFHIICPPLKKEQDRPYHRPIVLLRYLAHTRSKTALDMILKTRAFWHNAACTQRKKASE